MKRIKYLFILILLFISVSSVNAFNNNIKVYDYAQVLTEKQEIKLKKDIDKYINKYNIDMVIVSVKYYNQSNLSEYINLFYTKNNFGISDTKDGIIIVLDSKNNDIDIKTYGKANNLYSENELKIILDELSKEKNYYNKLSEFIEESNEYIDKFESDYYNSEILYNVNWFLIITLSIIISTIITLIFVLKNKVIKKEESNQYYINKDDIEINTKEDKFMTTNTKKERLNK